MLNKKQNSLCPKRGVMRFLFSSFIDSAIYRFAVNAISTKSTHHQQIIFNDTNLSSFNQALFECIFKKKHFYYSLNRFEQAQKTDFKSIRIKILLKKSTRNDRKKSILVVSCCRSQKCFSLVISYYNSLCQTERKNKREKSNKNSFAVVFSDRVPCAFEQLILLFFQI